MRHTAALYLRTLGMQYRAMWYSRTDLWLLVIGAILTQVVGFVVLAALFHYVPDVQGWTFWDVVLGYAVMTAADGGAELFFEGCWRLPGLAYFGELDYLLVRPNSVVLQVTSCAVGPNGLANITVGGVLIGLAAGRSSAHWSVPAVGLGVVFLASAVTIKVAINLAANASVFWLRSPFGNLAQAVHEGSQLARYPVSIYNAALQVVLATVIPVAFAGYLPVAYLVRHGRMAWLGLLAPAVAVVALVLANVVFRAGLRRYEGTGH